MRKYPSDYSFDLSLEEQKLLAKITQSNEKQEPIPAIEIGCISHGFEETLETYNGIYLNGA